MLVGREGGRLCKEKEGFVVGSSSQVGFSVGDLVAHTHTHTQALKIKES